MPRLVGWKQIRALPIPKGRRLHKGVTTGRWDHGAALEFGHHSLSSDLELRFKLDGQRILRSTYMGLEKRLFPSYALSS